MMKHKVFLQGDSKIFLVINLEVDSNTSLLEPNSEVESSVAAKINV